MPYKTKFIPQNTTKYVGNVDKILCKSLWERKLCKYFDSQDNVIKWCYECIKIPYISPVDNKKHNYYPDFLVLIKEKNGEQTTLVVEVKPQKQTEAPKNSKTKSYKNEMKTFSVNDAKWKAAKNICENNRWNFKILTEKNLFR
jgi:restriction endonuclease